jgi:hypothetical protein
MICDHRNRIRYFTCGHAGSAHDSKIWNESRMRHLLETRFVPTDPMYLIGDEGFGCSGTVFTNFSSIFPSFSQHFSKFLPTQEQFTNLYKFLPTWENMRKK